MSEAETVQQPFPYQEIVETLIQQVEKNYVFPAKAQEIAVVLRHQLASNAFAGIQDGQQLARTITEQLLEISQDRHLRLIYRVDGVTRRIDESEAYTPEEIERIGRKKEQSYRLKKLEILDGNIGYFRFDEFIHPHIAAETMSAAMTLLSNTRALIIDLRYNGGGESTMVQFLASYFFDPFKAEYIQLNGLYDRRKDMLYQSWALVYVPGERYLEKPVYILIGQKTFSAAEEFTYDLQQLKRAVVVGEKTRGGAHAGLHYPIHTHFEAFIPNARAINPISGTNWEGVGVQPDLPVPQEEALDLAYRKALAEIE